MSMYEEIDRKVQDGTLTIGKPWKDLPDPKISRTRLAKPLTLTFLGGMLAHLWKATDTQCGSETGCRAQARMYQCAVCREWFHLKCVADARHPPEKDKHYF